MDIDNIPFGTDFRAHLQETLDRCDILLVVIGPRWFGLDEQGKPRLSEEGDWVRIEVATALAKKIPVIPLLVEGARMPKPGELPEDLKGLAFRQAAVIDVGVDFRVHMERLIKSMDRILAVKSLPEPPTISKDAVVLKDAVALKDAVVLEEQQASGSQPDLPSTYDTSPPANPAQTDAEVFPHHSDVVGEQSAPVQDDSKDELQTSDEASVETSNKTDHEDQIAVFPGKTVPGQTAPSRPWLIRGAFMAFAAALALAFAVSSLGDSLVGSWCEDKSGPTRFKIEQTETGLIANGAGYQNARVSRQSRAILIGGSAYTLTMLGALVPQYTYGRIDPNYVRCSG
jgi:hypothetical protein